jgi:hypothetical protein
MGKFQEIAQAIADMLEKPEREDERWPSDFGRGEEPNRGEKIWPPDDLLGKISRIKGHLPGIKGDINLYPYGEPGRCCDFALFLSLQTVAYIEPRSRGHMSCARAIEEIVKHMQGKCPDITREALFLTDYWDGAAFQSWKIILHQIQRHACLEVYLLGGKKVSEFYL